MIVYFHGLNSSSRSHKAAMLRERLTGTQVLAPDYAAHRPGEAIATLSGFLCELGAHAPQARPIVVGSSMGGLYGQLLAQRFGFAHLFLINPALRPSELLAEYLGRTLTTADGETYVVTAELIQAFRRAQIDVPCAQPLVPTTVFLDTGDEVIDYQLAAELYRACGRLCIFAGGNHAFQHLDEAIRIIGETLARADDGL